MVRSAGARRRVLALPIAATAMVLLGTGTAQAAMLSGGDGLDVLALERDRNLDGVSRAAYLTLSPATAIETATTDDDPPFLCQMTPADMGED
jgi:hypothetical protein